MGARALCAYIRVRARESRILALRRTTPNQANDLRRGCKRPADPKRAPEKVLT